MRVVFVGSGPFGLPALELLAARPPGVKLVRVVSRPDRPQGRGGALRPVPVKARALEFGLPCDSPQSINLPEYLDSLRSLGADLLLVCDYGEILGQTVISLPRIGVFNLHASLLPKYRGAAPVVHALLAGEKVTGVTLFRVVPRVDAGPIVDSAELEVFPEETAGELEARLARLAAKLLERNLESLRLGTFREIPQDESHASLAAKISKSFGRIDWTMEPRGLADFVRALNPWPTAWSFLDRRGERERTIFLRVRPGPPGQPGSGAPGEVAQVRKDGFSVRCGGGTVEVLEIQRQGGERLDAAAYLRGRALKVGDRFSG